MSAVQRRINKAHKSFLTDGPIVIGIGDSLGAPQRDAAGDLRDRFGNWSGPNHPDKGKMDGRCNRTACQVPLFGHPFRYFMLDPTRVGGRNYYCATCADQFDRWDRQSGSARRIICEEVS